MNLRIRRGAVAAALALAATGAIMTALPTTARAQQPSGGGKDGGSVEQTPISLDVKDAPIRTVLEDLFRKVKADYSIDPRVSGYVTLRVTEQPFENVLRLVIRSATVPLTYTRDGGVYLVKPRATTADVPPSAPAAPPLVADAGNPSPGQKQYAVIHLNYIDPYDLAQLLNITMVPFFARANGFGPAPGGGGAPGQGARGGNALGGLGAGYGVGFDNTIIYFPPDGGGLPIGGGLPGGGRP